MRGAQGKGEFYIIKRSYRDFSGSYFTVENRRHMGEGDEMVMQLPSNLHGIYKGYGSRHFSSVEELKSNMLAGIKNHKKSLRELESVLSQVK